MKYIMQEYGSDCNLLQIPTEELKELEPFLLSLGVRCRRTKSECVDGVWIDTIQAENVWRENMRFYIYTENARVGAEKDLEPDSISIYKR